MRTSEARGGAFDRAEAAYNIGTVKEFEMWARVWVALLGSSGPLGTDEDLETAINGNLDDLVTAMFG